MAFPYAQQGVDDDVIGALCCENDSRHDDADQKSNHKNDHSEKGCSNCNFACQCCAVFLSITPRIEFIPDMLGERKNGIHLVRTPSSIVTQIWQPPKMS